MNTTSNQPAVQVDDPDVVAWANAYIQAGISVIPIQANGTKRPVGSWKPYQSQILALDRVQLLFTQGLGIAMICGRVSGGLEVLDFDERAEETMARWRTLIPEELFARLPIVRTGGGGFHVPYRCSTISPSQKIARTSERKVLIESRGERAYIVAVGSPRCTHHSGRYYEQIQGTPLPNLPVITEDERALL
ncbi:bifunctional DNA primase/polymerase, partial [Rhodopirellula bahusiensis]